MNGIDLRSIPSVDKVLRDPRIALLLDRHSREAVLALVRSALDEAREGALSDDREQPSMQSIVDSVVHSAESRFATWPSRVINATGVILHTNLGRSPLSEAAIEAASSAASGYTDLEFDLGTGRRGSRNKRISEILAEATGAQAGLVVNNNAAAVLLVLAAIAGDGQEVVVSRGQAVEIGGGFRIPDVLAQSGARLVEVGTTNKTYARDYEGAITENTAAVLCVHPSNFTVSGFTHATSLEELVTVCREKGVPVLNDLGSGSLIDPSRYGLGHEPLVQESVAAGASLTMFSGDKLLGGPQAGIVVGDAELVEKVGRHPLARALRADKVTLAALAATLGSYIRGLAESEVPIWRMISADVDELRSRAAAWRDASGIGTVEESESTVGGGSLPGRTLKTNVLAVNHTEGADRFARRLRSHHPPVVARIEHGRVILDPRTVELSEDDDVVDALVDASSAESES